MRRPVFFILPLVFLSLGSGGACSRAGQSGPSCAPTVEAAHLQELSGEFKRLRNMRGHFQGGVWNDEIDSWKGLKHRVMLELSACIARNRISILELKQLMGEPDQVIPPGHPAFDSLNRLAASADTSPPEQYFIYEWRGSHDYLVFASRKEMIVFSKWRYSWE